jgi:hypothetical protein
VDTAAEPRAIGSAADGGRSTLGRLRAAMLADPALARRLRTAPDAVALTALAIEACAERGWRLDAAGFAAGVAEARRESLRLHLTRTGPLAGVTLVGPGLAAAEPSRPLQSARDVVGLAPIGVGALDGEAVVEWCDLRGADFARPFFAETVSRALCEPYRVLSTCWTPLDALLAFDDGTVPDCLIFHVSRCGSTLLSRALGALPGGRAISEAAAIDDLVGLPGIDATTRSSALRGLVAALGRRDPIARGPLVVKLDAVAVFDLAVLRDAFRSTPRVFVYRDPRAVIASQMRIRGAQMVPGMIARHTPPGTGDAGSGEEYCAAMLDRFAEAALAGLDDGDLLVSYEELPDAVSTRVMPHIGLEPSPHAREIVQATAAVDVKSPDLPFDGRRHAAERPITPRIEDAARRLAWSSYERLEARRIAQIAGRSRC